MRVKIFTDSTSDISQELAKELGVEVIPLTIHFGEEEYIDGITLTNEAFYQKLEQSAVLPKTSQVSVGTMMEAFRQALDDGYDVLGVFLSSKLSGTYQASCIARDTLASDRIHVVDSRQVTVGLAMLVWEAVRLNDGKTSASEIAEKLEVEKGKIIVYGAIETLDYVRKGGRLSAAGKLLGTVLNLKPIVQMDNGRVVAPHRARGNRNALAWIVERLRLTQINLSKGIIYGQANCLDKVKQLQRMVEGVCKFPFSHTLPIGSVVGTYSGPGCVGFAVMEN
ncbi:MAG: DegV family protein [Christensenellales bacterium]|jgi:DegV family protein with EDD domain